MSRLHLIELTMDTIAIILNLIGTCLFALGTSHYLKWSVSF